MEFKKNSIDYDLVETDPKDFVVKVIVLYENKPIKLKIKNDHDSFKIGDYWLYSQDL